MVSGCCMSERFYSKKRGYSSIYFGYVAWNRNGTDNVYRKNSDHSHWIENHDLDVRHVAEVSECAWSNGHPSSGHDSGNTRGELQQSFIF